MSIIPSRQQKNHVLSEPILALALIGIIATLMLIWLNANIYDGSTRAWQNQTVVQAPNPVITGYSFKADKAYWKNNCSHGWNGNSTCEDIVARAQACEVFTVTESTYCADYKEYLKQFLAQ